MSEIVSKLRKCYPRKCAEVRTYFCNACKVFESSSAIYV